MSIKKLMQTALVTGGVTIAAASTHADEHDATWRFPIVTVPLLQTAPQIDGTIYEQEWSRATLLPPLLEAEPAPRAGMPSRYPSHVWMGYTSDALYVAWRQELPPESLPEKPTHTNARDAHEGVDNSVNFMFADDKHEEQWNIAGNAANSIYDRRFDTGQSIHWDADLTYRSRVIPAGWEGELKIPFKELGSTPVTGTRWHGYFYSSWRGKVSRFLAFPHVRWRGKGEYATFVFAGDETALRFDERGMPQVLGANADVKTVIYRRREKSKQAFYPQVVSAVQNAQVEGGTFASLDKIISDALASFETVSTFHTPGEYLVRYDITRGEKVLARGVQPYYLAPPLDLEITPRLLNAGVYSVEAQSDIAEAQMLRTQLMPSKSGSTQAPFHTGVANADVPAKDLPQGHYQLVAQAQAKEKILAKVSAPVDKPAPPDWWTKKGGLTPLIPPPWTPVKATPKTVEVQGRKYSFNGLPIPAQVVTKGKELFVAPPQLATKTAWKNTSWKVLSQTPDAVVYASENVAGNVKMKATTRVEFDGFIRVDLDLSGTGQTDKLDLVVPFKKENAVLLANYMKAPGPGNDPKVKRFTNMIPAEGYVSPPMITTWIGTDYYGLETAMESTRGWAMASPNEASQVMPSGDRVLFTLRIISKPIKLSSKPRRITFAMIATPTKELTPYMKTSRYYDDLMPMLLPYDWAGYPAWHPPVKDPAVIAKTGKMVEERHKAGSRPLLNGGWAISTTAPEWENWGKEMTAEPLQNVSYSGAKQFAHCWRSPFSEFMANSFAYNAKLLKFDGIRFDTVTPGYTCSSLYHHDDYGQTCGWRDDDGNLWPSMSMFAEREMMKRLYRTFHGSVIKDGAIWLPNAGPPITAVHSFADLHEIGEGFYQYAKTLKEGYAPGLVRAMMAGNAYGLRTLNNIKDAPLFWNERIAALLVGGAEPRWEDHRGWKPGYEAHAKPAPSVWDAWDWVDHWNAEFFGWWNSGDYVQIEKPDADALLLSSFYLNRKTKRVLLVVTNYEKDRPFAGLGVKLNLQKLGLTGKVYGEDAITMEPVEIGDDGTMKLDVLGQRYRLVQISQTPPRYRDEMLGENLLTASPLPLQTEKQTYSPELKVAPNNKYVVSAWIKIDKNIGEGTETSNFMGPFAPTVRQYAYLQFSGDVIGVNGTNVHSLCPVEGKPGVYIPYVQTEEYKRNYFPQLWEKTGGWTRIWLPVQTGAKADKIRVIWGTSDPQVTSVKDWSLRQVK